MGAESWRALDRSRRRQRRSSDEHRDPPHPRGRGRGGREEAGTEPRRYLSEGRLPDHAHAAVPARRDPHRESGRAHRRRPRPEGHVRLLSVAVPGRRGSALPRSRHRRMKPGPFEYHAPASLQEACSLLGSLEDAKVLAGGQSLIPLLNIRLARPAHLVDINRIPNFDRIYERDGGIAVGALARQSDVEDSQLVARVCPLLIAAMRVVAHRVIRNRGTVCGNLAHADPASELPAVLLALAGHVVARSARGSRIIPAADFFTNVMQTRLAPDELLTEAWFPKSTGRFGIAEESRRHGEIGR